VGAEKFAMEKHASKITILFNQGYWISMTHKFGLKSALVTTFSLWAAIFYTTILSTIEIWIRSETFNHCFIILPVCIYVIYLEWPRLRQADTRPNWWIALPLILISGIWILGSLAQLLVIEQGAAFLLLPLMLWLVLGNQVAKTLWFPYLFWMFSVPFGEVLVPQLQELTADITVYLIEISGIAVYREGLYIAVPNGLFEVAVACSGIRYLIASFSLGTIFAYLNYQSMRKRIVFVLFSLTLPLLANGIRAYGIVMIAHLSDMKYATGVDHLIYGWLFFGLVIFIMFAIGNIWREPPPALSDENIPVKNMSVVPIIVSMSLSILMLFGGTIYRDKIAVVAAVNSTPPLLSELFTVTVSDDPSWLPEFQNVSASLDGKLGNVDMYVAYYSQNVQGQELINTTNLEYNKNAWTVIQKTNYQQYVLVEIVSSRGEKRFIAYSYFIPSTTTASRLHIKLKQAFEALLGESRGGAYIAVSALQSKGNSAQEVVTAKMNSLIEQGYEGIFAK
jgi:exosortase A